MSYTPNTWKSGDVVTSAKLNNIENGIASAVLKVNAIMDEQTGTMTLDKTWQEINDAGFAVMALPYDGGEGFGFAQVTGVYKVIRVGSGYTYFVGGVAFSAEGSATALSLATDSADGYPSVQMG